MNVVAVLFYSMILPAAISAILLVLGGRGEQAEVRQSLASGYAVLGAAGAVYFWVNGWPAWPLTTSTDWLLGVGVVAVLLVLTEALLKGPIWRGAARGLGFALALRMVLDSRMDIWGTGETWGVILGLSVYGLVAFKSLDLLYTRGKGPVFGLVLAGNAGILAIVLALSSTVSLAQILGGAAIGALILSAHLRWQRPSHFRPAIGLVVLLCTVLGVMGVLFADLKLEALLLLGLMPFTTWLGATLKWPGYLIGLLIPAGLALALSTSEEVQPETEVEEDSYYPYSDS